MRTSPVRGQWAEDEACRYLAGQQGWRLVARNVRLGGGEIDLILEEGATLVFVEVKARASGEAQATAAVSADKKRRLGRAAALWLGRHGVPAGGCRFDVVTVVGAGSDARVNHYPDAFTAPDRWAV